MQYTPFFQQVCKWLLVASLWGFGLAMAQAEPTLNQVYATAQAGKLDQAQVMLQQVLISHPNSAKAYFVQSELYARQGNLGRAREALATAEKLTPGLPFAKPEAVQALRTQLSAKSAPTGLQSQSGSPSHMVAAAAPQVPAASSWGLPLLLAGGAIVLGYFMFRRRSPAPAAQPPAYANQGGLGGPQTFGMAGGSGPMAGQAEYGQPAYGQPGYGQPAGSGLGGRIMGGVATGLAVGAGVMAAEAIGRNLMGNHQQPTDNASHLGNNDFQPIASNPDMGGQDFGVNDSSSWDDGGSVDSGSSNDWDN
jgi:hypothetical protein